MKIRQSNEIWPTTTTTTIQCPSVSLNIASKYVHMANAKLSSFFCCLRLRLHSAFCFYVALGGFVQEGRYSIICREPNCGTTCTGPRSTAAIRNYHRHTKRAHSATSTYRCVCYSRVFFLLSRGGVVLFDRRPRRATQRRTARHRLEQR